MDTTDDVMHCRDCCCARSWKALGIFEYTGRSIPEHIKQLRLEREELLALAHQFAGECSECGGKGTRALGLSGYREDCPDCADIRAVIRKIEGRT